MPAKFTLTKDRAGKFRFSLLAANGQVVANSAAYATKASALNGLASVRQNAAGAALEDTTIAKPAARRATPRKAAAKPAAARRTVTRSAAKPAAARKTVTKSAPRASAPSRTSAPKPNGATTSVAKPAVRKPAVAKLVVKVGAAVVRKASAPPTPAKRVPAQRTGSGSPIKPIVKRSTPTPVAKPATKPLQRRTPVVRKATSRSSTGIRTAVRTGGVTRPARISTGVRIAARRSVNA